MKVTGFYQCKVTRDSDLFVDDEEVDDLLRALEGELPSRRFSVAVRLEVADNCPDDLSFFLLQTFSLNEEDMYRVKGPVNLNRLLAIHELVDRSELKFSGFTPDIPPRLLKNTNIFESLHHGDILLHHPFQSFAPVIDFLRQAAADPNVLSIKQTLYRTGDGSVIVEHLKAAAKAGKEVTVIIELRARFDEEANIELANELQEVGAHVVYRVVGYKTHAKMNALVDPEIIRALYKASQAGVKIDLIVRGICCLRPGIKGVSDNIQVRSIIGRFLEHTRIFYFFNGGEEPLFCSSADWMPRNLHHRVEIGFPIEEKRPRDQIMKYGLMNYLSDNTQAWILQSDGSYKRSKPGNAKPRSAQDILLEYYCHH